MSGIKEPAPTNGTMSFETVWREELTLILQPTTPMPPPDVAAPRDPRTALQQSVDQLPQAMAALCLSGGGIRSASFALGVLQALSRFGLLEKFHYLSTVSGGGYIGSWLSAWRTASGDTAVRAGLASLLAAGKEDHAITGIRADSNYLTPQLGLLSPDTWTVIALYIRNLTLNWCVYLPLFLGLLMIPRLARAILEEIKPPGEILAIVLLGISAACLLLALEASVRDRHVIAAKTPTRRGYRLKVLLPSGVAAICWTLALPLDYAHAPTSHWAGSAIGAGLYAASWVIARVQLRTMSIDLGVKDFFCWTWAGAVVGLLAALALKLTPDMDKSLLTVLGPSFIVLALAAGELVYVGTGSYLSRGEEDREWLARSSGYLFAGAIAWGGGAGIALYGSTLLGYLSEQAHHALASAAAGTAGVSGVVTLLLGWSKQTAATVSGVVTRLHLKLMQLASIAGTIFGFSLALLLAAVDARLETLLIGNPWIPDPRLIALGLLLVLVAVAVLISCAINVNRFSLHALYRNRLIRAFLGSANPNRDPDHFTGFDFADNVKMTAVTPKPPGRLFHVINTALNLVRSDNPAWQERKAASFTITPLSCGSDQVGYRPTERYGDRDGGISLGTAMAISGAAVSPNQGYNSSPIVGLLLMLFNVRLGWWLGNPKIPGAWEREGPRFSLVPILNEFVGNTTDDGPWVYLSDGGHFDNLGLYEMVRRRCRFIVVSDAGCDPTCSFEDLGNAARKCFIDFGVSIRFARLDIRARGSPTVPAARMALGSIHYPGSTVAGTLIYVKPTFLSTTEPPDVRSYATGHAAFPHESTTDQWFTESQLESYRALGAHIFELICTAGAGASPSACPASMSFADLEYAARQM